MEGPSNPRTSALGIYSPKGTPNQGSDTPLSWAFINKTPSGPPLARAKHKGVVIQKLEFKENLKAEEATKTKLKQIEAQYSCMDIDTSGLNTVRGAKRQLAFNNEDNPQPQPEKKINEEGFTIFFGPSQDSANNDEELKELMPLAKWK
ncbi:hypothetical protein CJ030_MR0G024308 [Morella rubra]|uniref:Uncharacterized protein n=1 Tax=Morella rubra TaxID=262757 RepID=A0A6A1UHW0_9ROSI|nr:hypothetical protein CJ030_MR0G024308 [Morella rubra]